MDLDATDDPLYGEQEGRFFHGYYRHYCYLPLYIFCGGFVLWSELRRSDLDGSAGSVEALERIVGQIRERWPAVEIWIETTSGPRVLGEDEPLHGGDTVQVLFDPAGAAYVTLAGRDATPPFPVGPFYTRDCKLLGFAMFNATPEQQQGCAHDIMRWMTEGKLEANIDRVLPLEQLAEAHRLQEQSTVGLGGQLAGKIVIRL